MPAGQMRVRTRGRKEQRRILWEQRIRRLAPADPQLVLPLLQPPKRRAPTIHFEPEIVFVACAHLADRHAALRAAVEPNENRGEVLALNRERLAFVAAAASERLSGAARLQTSSDDGREIGEDGDDPLTSDVLY